jgi:hypothetical protein
LGGGGVKSGEGKTLKEGRKEGRKERRKEKRKREKKQRGIDVCILCGPSISWWVDMYLEYHTFPVFPQYCYL